MSAATQVRPILRWAGSKRQLLPLLSSYWKGAERYVEPFAGSCCLFYRLGPEVALLADKNPELIEMYDVLRRHPKAPLHQAVTSLHTAKWLYLQVRALRPADLTQLERAARFIYLNRNCFNGIYRTNLRGEFNVPFAHYKQGLVPTLDELVARARISFVVRPLGLGISAPRFATVAKAISST